jgi:hypothetical protein
MRRIPFPGAAVAAALVVLLTGCAGETPTSPNPGGGGGGGGNGGNCTVTIDMTSTAVNPVAGSEVVVRASVKRSGAAVPDGTSVQFSTDLGFFAENGLQTVSKTTLGGNADITLFSASAGPAHVKATFECASNTATVTFSGSTSQGPFISSYSPQSGTCAGGDTVTIKGGLFGANPGSVLFGGAPASITSWAANQVVVTTPLHTLKDPLKPESVNLVVVAQAGQTQPVPFVYFCVDQRMTIASLNPVAGSPAGGDSIQILGSHFGTTIATTTVTFCGLPAQITSQADNLITVSTPAHTLANPALSEACPVVVTRDVGLPSMQSATSPVNFVYRGSGGTGSCNTDPTFFVSSLTPNTGTPDGGTVVTFTGNGFPTSAALLRVEFGGNPGTVVGTPTSTSFQVSTPRRVLASPDVPETVDVVVTDLGSVSQRCYRVAAAFIYTAAALDPSFFSISPRTGPNDQATRATIFGLNFQFPMQVFMTGGACGAQRVEASVISVTPTQIVFNTPVALGGNFCLGGQLVDVVILNPATGKTAACSSCFKYYSCPVISGASPIVGSMTSPTTVVISGSNFAEPVIANYRSGSTLAPIQVTSVSNTSIIVTMPPLSALKGGSLSCGNTDGNIELTFVGLNCTPSPLATGFSYRADPPTITAASPTNLNQDGSLGGGPLGTPATITVTGANFAAPMTVTLIANGGPVPGTPVNNANVSSPTSLTFPAPAVLNASLNQQNCLSGGSITGTKYVPTSFGIRVTNTLTGCSVDLPNILVYNPTDTTCRAGLSILPLTLGNGKVGNAYSATFTAGGGAGPPFTWGIASGTLPPGSPAFALNPSTGAFTGTPTTAGTYTFTVQVTDSSAATQSRFYTLQIDP